MFKKYTKQSYSIYVSVEKGLKAILALAKIIRLHQETWLLLCQLLENANSHMVLKATHENRQCKKRCKSGAEPFIFY
jgi:hypothetical protein